MLAAERRNHFTGIMIGTTCGVIFIVLSVLAVFHTRKLRIQRAQSRRSEVASTASFDVHQANAPPSYDTGIAVCIQYRYSRLYILQVQPFVYSTGIAVCIQYRYSRLYIVQVQPFVDSSGIAVCIQFRYSSLYILQVQPFVYSTGITVCLQFRYSHLYKQFTIIP